MTGAEMNALLLKKSGLVVMVGVSLTAGGCLGVFDPQTDPTSPVAPRVRQLVEENRRYPRWEDFPSSPTALPAPAEIAGRVNTLKIANVALASEVGRIDWTLTEDPVAFAESISRRVNASHMAPATAQTAAEVEAFAAELRARAKAPPPVDRPLP